MFFIVNPMVLHYIALESIPHEMSHFFWFVRFYYCISHRALGIHPFIQTIFMYLFQGLVERLQEDIEYKQNKYRDDLSSVTSGLDSLYEYINSGPVDFMM